MKRCSTHDASGLSPTHPFRPIPLPNQMVDMPTLTPFGCDSLTEALRKVAVMSLGVGEPGAAQRLSRLLVAGD